jgi:cytochrome P450
VSDWPAGQYDPAVSLAPPAPVTQNGFARIAQDLRGELAGMRDGGFPPGPTSFSLGRTYRFAREPLPILLDAYERFGPVFSIRVFHGRVVFALGPEANHYITVSHAENFNWRESSFGDLIPLLGDGLLTIDAPHHKRARRIMQPAFHHQRVAESIDTMLAEGERAIGALRPGATIDVYGWARELTLRIAMRALFGLDPDDGGHGAQAARAWERALSFYGIDYPRRIPRGPFSPWQRMQRAKRELDAIIYAEIRRRRAEPAGSAGVLGQLLDARDEDGDALSDEEVRDQVMTLMFAGHDTSTATLSFMLHELAGHPDERELVVNELNEVLGEERPSAEQLMGGALPRLEMVLDETLRLYPPAWIGPRRAVAAFELCGRHVPAGAYVNYCSWASHRLPDVFPEPHEFRPERFARERKAALPKGAYVPFGGGSRTCIGMRFGQLENKALATLLLRRRRLERAGDEPLRIRQMPTLGARGGLPMTVAAR